MGNLQKQAVKSIKWTAFATLVIGISGPILLLAQAKFLSPREFASLAIITIFIGLFKIFEDFGISQAVIQRDSVNTEEMSSLFYFNIIFATIIFSLFFMGSSFIAAFFSISELESLLEIAAILLLVNSPSLLFRALLEKSLYFKELSIINILRQLILIITTILLLSNNFGVLAVVLGQVISVSISSILIITVSIKKEIVQLRFYYSFSKVVPFIRFGVYVSGKQIMTFLTHHLDELIIGYFFTKETLGFYHFAKNMLEQLRSLITASFSKVLFPMFSKLKNDPLKLKNAYKDISKYIGFVSFPVFTGIALTAHLFVPIIFGGKWLESVLYFQVFSLTLIFLVLTANISTSLLYSLGKPNVVFYIDVITNITYLLSLTLFSSYGVVVVLTIYCSYVMYKTVTLQIYTSNNLGHSFYEYIIVFRNIFLMTILMSGAVIAFQLIFKTIINDVGLFLGSVLLGMISYSITALLFERKTIIGLKRAIFSR